MKAIIYNKKGSSEKLSIQEIEKPIPAAKQVLIKIHSVSPNAADYRSLKMGMIPKSKIFGSGISGIVEKVGDRITKYRPGDEILADLADFGFGGFAEYCVAPEKAIARKPENISFEQAATLPVAATTALKALRDKGNIQKDQEVIIIGSSGGVGTYALQLAKYFGTEVTAVCSPRNIEQSISLGADHTIDYTKVDFTKGKTRYDLIVAINGNYSLIACKRLLKKNGIYVMVGGSMGQIFKALIFGKLLSIGSQKIKTLSAKTDPRDLELVAQLAAEGKIKPVIERRYDFAKTADAMTYLSQGRARSKVVANLEKST